MKNSLKIKIVIWEIKKTNHNIWFKLNKKKIEKKTSHLIFKVKIILKRKVSYYRCDHHQKKVNNSSSTKSSEKMAQRFIDVSRGKSFTLSIWYYWSSVTIFHNAA